MKKTNYNLEIFLVFVELCLTVLALICCGIVIFHSAHEVSAEGLAQLRHEFLMGLRSQLLPELRERTTFVSLSLLCPVLSLGAIYVCEIGRRNLRDNASPRVIFSGALILNILILSISAVCFIIKPRFLTMLFDPVINNYFILAVVLILSAAAVYAVFRFNFNSPVRRILYPVLLLMPVIQIFCCRIYTLDRISLMADEPHSNIISYAVSQAAAGLNDCHQYGFYHRMLAPIFRAISPGLFNISVVMAIIYMVALFCIYLVIFKLTKNKILVLGFAAVMFLACGGVWNFIHIVQGTSIDPYFAYFPIRFLFPALAVLFYYMLIAEKRKYLIACGILSGCALWWNFDSGVPVVGAFGAVMFLEFIFSCERRRAFLKLLWFGIAAILGFCAVLLLLTIDNGQLPPFMESLKYVSYFSSSGFMMLPMPGIPAPWCFFAGIYVLGIIIGIRGFATGRPDIISRMSLFLSVLGVGLFTYYQGRSHTFNLPGTVWPAMLLLFVYTDRLIRLIKTKQLNRLYKMLIFPAMFFMVFSFVTIMLDAKMIAAGISRTIRGISEMNNLNQVEINVRFILANAGDCKTVNIQSGMQGIYYAETGLRAGINNFNLVELLLEKDLERISKELQNAKVPMFISMPPNVIELPASIKKYYKLQAISPSMTMLYLVPRNSGQE
jgi:hypothetical protein